MIDRIAFAEAEVERLKTIERPMAVVARYSTAAGQSIANNTLSIVNFGTLVIDTHNTVTVGASWQFTAPTKGYYNVMAAVMFASTTTWANGEVGQIELYKNGARWSVLRRDSAMDSTAATQFKQLVGCDIVSMVTGDTLNIRVTQITGAALSLHTDATFNYVSIAKYN